MNKRSNIAPIAIFFAVMLVIHFLSSLLFNLFPFPIKPTIVHIPVIIASIIYGPRVGVTLGSVSYTHLDVYKRQRLGYLSENYLHANFLMEKSKSTLKRVSVVTMSTSSNQLATLSTII